MPQPRPADTKDAAGPPAGSATDADAATGGAKTHTSVDGEASPRQPHEHDESSDSGSRPPDPVIAQAAKDVQSGKQQTDRGETTDAVYGEHLRGGAGDRR